MRIIATWAAVAVHLLNVAYGNEPKRQGPDAASGPIYGVFVSGQQESPLCLQSLSPTELHGIKCLKGEIVDKGATAYVPVDKVMAITEWKSAKLFRDATATRQIAVPIPYGSIPYGPIPAGPIPAGPIPAGGIPAGGIAAGTHIPASVYCPVKAQFAKDGQLALSWSIQQMHPRQLNRYELVTRQGQHSVQRNYKVCDSAGRIVPHEEFAASIGRNPNVIASCMPRFPIEGFGKEWLFVVLESEDFAKLAPSQDDSAEQSNAADSR